MVHVLLQDRDEGLLLLHGRAPGEHWDDADAMAESIFGRENVHTRLKYGPPFELGVTVPTTSLGSNVLPFG